MEKEQSGGDEHISEGAASLSNVFINQRLDDMASASSSVSTSGYDNHKNKGPPNIGYQASSSSSSYMIEEKEKGSGSSFVTEDQLMDDFQKIRQALHDKNSERGPQVVNDHKNLHDDLLPSSDSAVACHQATLSGTCERSRVVWPVFRGINDLLLNVIKPTFVK